MGVFGFADLAFVGTAATPGGSTDPDFASVSLLLPFDGADGSTTFTDASSNNITPTRTGTPTISTAQSKYGGSSLLLAGGDNFLSFDGGALTLLSLPADFTIECDVRATSDGGQIVCGQDTDSINIQIFRLNLGGAGAVFCLASDVSLQSAAGLVSLNTWHHLALTRSGTSVKLFIDGIERASESTSATISIRKIGSVFGLGVVGNIDNFRVTKGIARYTANFTPPTGPFPTS